MSVLFLILPCIIAMAMAAGDSESSKASKDVSNTANTNAYAEYSVIEKEETLKLENWMTNDAVFSADYKVEEETETPLELESWMTNETTFSAPASAFAVETESKLEVENWMMNDDVFKVDAKKAENKIYSAKNFVYKNL